MQVPLQKETPLLYDARTAVSLSHKNKKAIDVSTLVFYKSGYS